MIMPQPKRLFLFVLMLLVGLIPTSVFAQQSPLIFVIRTFDNPGVGNSTTPFGINDRGDIAGDYVDSNNVRRGFVRFGNGTFSPPIVEPGDTGNFTRARGINNGRTVVGDFFGGIYFHGYLLRNGGFTQFDVGPTVSTGIFGINDRGNFVGSAGSNLQPNRPFINLGGTTTIITIPGALEGQAVGINDRNRVVGTYRDVLFRDHGFIRSPGGALTNPVDFPGSTITVLNGINNWGWIVGRYTDSSGNEHGLFRKNSNTIVKFDFPGATATSLNGINDFGFISGRYTDGSGIRHGFVAWVFAFPDFDRHESDD
jgi:hypothetical protein